MIVVYAGVYCSIYPTLICNNHKEGHEFWESIDGI